MVPNTVQPVHKKAFVGPEVEDRVGLDLGQPPKHRNSTMLYLNEVLIKQPGAEILRDESTGVFSRELYTS